MATSCRIQQTVNNKPYNMFNKTFFFALILCVCYLSTTLALALPGLPGVPHLPNLPVVGELVNGGPLGGGALGGGPLDSITGAAGPVAGQVAGAVLGAAASG